MNKKAITTLISTLGLYVCMVALHGVALASDVRSVAVLKIGPDSPHAAAIWTEIRRVTNSKSIDGYKVVNLHNLLNANGETEARDTLEKGLAFAKAGKASLSAGDTEKAILQMEDAVSKIESSFVYLTSLKAYRNLLYNLAAAYLKKGDGAKAKAKFKRAALMRAKAPAGQEDTAAGAALQQARQLMRGKKRGGIKVLTDPGRAEVYVNGVFKGVTPLTLSADVGPRAGQHIVTLKKLGYVRQTEVVNVTSGQQTTVLTELPFARQYILLQQILKKLPAAFANATKSKRTASPTVKRIGEVFGCDVTIIINVTGPANAAKVSTKIFDTAARRLLNQVDGTIDWSYRNRNAVKRMVRKLIDFDYASALGASKGSNVPVVVKKYSITDRWWFWTIVGAAVIGATAGTVYGVLTAKPEPFYPKDGSGAVVLQF
jgi:tetratricopeptide (TPR) repeat protein